MMTVSFRRALALLAVATLVGLLPVQAQQRPDAEAMTAAMQRFYQGDWEGAIRAFDAILEADPQNALALSYLLHAYYKKKDINGIINRIEQQAVSRGGDPVVQAHLGMAYFLRGLIMPNALDEALTEFKQALKDKPDLALARTGIGLIYFQKRMMPRAKGYFIQALRANPYDVLAMDRLGNILLVDEKKPDEALQLYRRIIALLPAYPDGQYFTGSALYDLGRYEEAIPYLKEAVALDPHGYTQGFEAAALLGDTQLKLQRYNDAMEAYQTALKIRPDSKYVQVRMEQARNPQTIPGRQEQEPEPSRH